MIGRLAAVISLPVLLWAQTPLACLVQSAPRSVRYEGMTELVGDILMTCSGGPAQAAGTVLTTMDVTVSLNTNVTSRILNSASNPGASEALLLIDDPGSGQAGPAPGFGSSAPQLLCFTVTGAVKGGCVEVAATRGSVQVAADAQAYAATGAVNPGANVFQGTVSGSQVIFHGVPVLSGNSRIFRITNIRANVAGLQGGVTGPPPVTATVSAGGPTIVNLASPVQPVGTVQTGLKAAVRDAANSAVLATSGNTFTQCSGASSPAPVAVLSFAEGYVGAFLTRSAPTTTYNGQSSLPVQNVPGSLYNSESGFVLPAAASGGVVAGLADYGTRLKATFNNIPSGVRIFVSTANLTTDTSSATATAPAGNSPTPYAALVQSESAADGNGTVSLTASTTTANSGSTKLTELTVTNGSATAVWEVINTNPNASETLLFGVWQQFATGSGSPSLGTATVNLNFAPIVSSSAGSQASTTSPVARFTDTSTPANLLSITACTSGCTYTLTGNTAYSAAAVTGNVTIAASATSCAWTASSPVNWITITSGSSGTGNGSVQFNILANPNSTSRSATLTIAGQSFNVAQPGVKTNTTTVLTASTPTPGQAVTLTATVSPSIATGSVTFNDGPTPLGQGTLNGSGAATLATANLSAGGHLITAVYSGDNSYNGSTSPTITVTVGSGKTATNIAVTASPSPANAGATVTITAMVMPTAATGTITFNDGPATLKNVSVTGGVASMTTTNLAAGTHTLTASYSGDNSYEASTSLPFSETINPAAGQTATTLSTSPNPAANGQAVTMTATVTPSTATGTVTFKDGSTALGNASLAGGTATYTNSSMTAGSHLLIAAYGGDSGNSASTSATVTEVVTSLTATTTVLTSSPNPATVGQTVNLTASVTPASASGNVTFNDGSTSLGAAPLSNGTATLPTAALTAGIHSLTASYAGNTAYASSTSTAVAQAVNAGGVTVTLTATPNPGAYSQNISLTATVNPGTATGMVTFTDVTSGNPVGLSTISNGTATLVTSTLKAGLHTLQATYNGDTTYPSAKSPTITETVNSLATTLTLTASSSSATPGQAVTLTANLSTTGATGTVLFKDGDASIGAGNLNNGTATLTTSTLPAGSHTITASYGGDSNYAGSSSSQVLIAIGASTSCATLPAGFVPFSSIANLSQPNSAGDLAAVGSMSTANFAIVQNLPQPAAPNQLFCGTVFLAPGIPVMAYVPTAAEKSGNFSAFAGLLLDPAASGSPFPGGVIPASRIPATFAWRIVGVLQTSTTVLSVTPAQAGAGQAVTLTASVAPTSAAGTVTFVDGSTSIGTASLSAGTATITTSTLTVGSHNLWASYGGDTRNASSASNQVAATIVATTATTISLSVNPVSSTPGQTVTITATVTPATATGTVTFKEGATTIGTANLSSGAATMTTSTLATGNHNLTAVYGGDNKNSPSISNSVAATVALAATTTALTLTPTSATTGQPVTLTATLSPSSATGTLIFKDGSTALGSANLASGTASLTTSALSAGSHTLTASYSGDSNYAASTSTAVTASVGNATTTALAVTPSPATLGQAVTLTATVSPVTSTGSVTFKDGSTTLGTANLTAGTGTATLTTSTLAAGNHTLTAVYAGDSLNGSSTSAPVTETVGLLTTTTALTVTPANPTIGQTITMTATVTPSPATGSITFQDGSTSLGTVSLSNGTAVFTTSTLTSGNHSLTAVYSGDSKNGASTSSPVSTTVGAPTTTTTLSATPSPSNVGQSITLTATVSPATATGSVTFQDGSTPIGTSALANGAAIFTTAALTAGNHTLTAIYGGDSKNGGSTSNAVNQSVAKLASSITLTASPATASPGQSVTLTATVTPSGATGNVTFLDSQAVLSTVPISSGTALYTTSSLAAGSHALSASYGGDSRDVAGISPTIAYAVGSGNSLQVTQGTPTRAFTNTTWSQTFKVTGGTPPYRWSMPSNTMTDLSMNASGDTAVVSGTPQTAGAFKLTLLVQDASQSLNTPVNLTVYPPAAITITAPQPTSPADQPTPQLSLSQAYDFALTGTLTLTFAPNAPGLPNGYNAAQFPDGTTRFAVTIPANSTVPNPPIPAIQLGSVAGDIAASLGPLMITGTAQTVPLAGAAPTVKITVPRLGPAIVPGSVRIVNITPSGFQVFLDATSNTRDLTSGTFVFTAASGTQMTGCTPNCVVTFGNEAAAWFASAEGIANGGTTSLTVPFTFSGDTSVIGTVSVTLTNSVGNSSPASGGK